MIFPNVRLFDGKLRVDRDLESVGEGVGLGRHADDSEEFGVLLFGETLCPGRGSVGMNTVAAVVGDGDGDVDKLFGERIESAGFNHDLLDAGPGSLEESGLVSEHPPEVIDEVGFSGGANVVEDCLDAWVGGDFGVGEKFLSWHGQIAFEESASTIILMILFDGGSSVR